MSPAPPAPQCCANDLAANTQPLVQSWMTARLNHPRWGQELMARGTDGRDPVGLLGKVCRGLVAKGSIWWTSTLLENQELVKWSSSEKHLKDLTGKLLLVNSSFGAWEPFRACHAFLCKNTYLSEHGLTPKVLIHFPLLQEGGEGRSMTSVGILLAWIKGFGSCCQNQASDLFTKSEPLFLQP